MHRNTKFVKSQEKMLTSFMDGITLYVSECAKKMVERSFYVVPRWQHHRYVGNF